MKPFLLEDEFGDIIHKARQGLGLSMEQVAHATGLTKEDLAAMETYRLEPKLDQTQQLAAFLHLNPDKLWSIASNSFILPQVPTTLGDFALWVLPGETGESNCYIVQNTRIQSGVIIDPGVSLQRIGEIIKDNSIPIQAVLITHRHGDHIKSLDGLVDEFAVPVYPDMSGEITLALGGTDVVQIPTPGHTEDSVCFLFPGFIFVGDLLFAGSVGRAQVGKWNTHLQHVNTILRLPGTTLVLPGHGPVTTCKTELIINPFFSN